jgi:hypothetical protein
VEANVNALLSEDQNALIRLFSDYDRLVAADGTDEKRAALVDEICRQSKKYIRLGEEVFHPAVRPAIEDEELLELSVANQEDAKHLLAKVSTMSPDETFYDAWVALLGCCMQQLIERDQRFGRAAAIADDDAASAPRREPRRFVTRGGGAERGSLDT